MKHDNIYLRRKRSRWLEIASRGERATLRRDQSFLNTIKVDYDFCEQVMIATMSKRAQNVLIWLLETNPPSRRVLNKAIGQLPPSIVKAMLGNHTWESLPGGKISTSSMIDAIRRHPQGWKAAIENIEVCKNAGMPVPGGDYGILYQLADLSPKNWALVSSENETALERLIEMGVKPDEWDERVYPRYEHPLNIAIDNGNLEAASILIKHTSTAFKHEFIETLVSALSPRKGKYNWGNGASQSQQRGFFIDCLFNRCGNKKKYLLDKLADKADLYDIPASTLSTFESFLIHEQTQGASALRKSPRL